MYATGQEGSHMKVNCHRFQKLFNHHVFSVVISTVIPVTILTIQICATYIGKIYLTCNTCMPTFQSFSMHLYHCHIEQAVPAYKKYMITLHLQTIRRHPCQMLQPLLPKPHLEFHSFECFCRLGEAQDLSQVLHLAPVILQNQHLTPWQTWV